MKSKGIGGNRYGTPSPFSIQAIILFLGILIAIGVAAYLTYYKPAISISPQLPTNYQRTIVNFLEESLREKYLPDSLDFNERSRPVPGNVTYAANWTGRNIPLTVSYNANSKIEFLTIAASVPEISAPLTDKVSSSLAKKFFKNFEEKWECREVGNYSFCESFWIKENRDKRSVFVFTPFGKPRPNTLVVSCVIPFGSEFYERNSCIESEQV